MKSSIKSLAFVAALAAGAAFHSPAAAQQQQGGWDGPRREQGQRMDPAQRTERRLQQLTQRLHLSSAQQGQIRGILQREQQQFERFRGARGEGRGQQGQARRNGDDAQRRQGFEQMRQLRQQTDQQIERVLSSQQLAEYRRLQQERGQRGGRDGQGRDWQGRDGQGRQQGGQGWSGQR